MNKCCECDSTIFNSRRYRYLKERLVQLDKRFENIVDDLCQDCLEKELDKYIRNEIRVEMLKRLSNRAVTYEKIYDEDCKALEVKNE